MKIVSWNCGGAFRKKHHLIESAYKPDLMIIQECENPALSTAAFKDWAKSYLWIGENKNKGIGVFDLAGVGLEPLPWDAENLQSFLPCKVGTDLSLLAVWTKQANSPNFRYIGQLWKYLQLHRESIEQSAPMVIAGDLNSNSCWDEWDRWWNHTDVVRELGEMGLRSLYHHNYKEGQGHESRPTLYHQYKLEKPYHVDYVFTDQNSVTETNHPLEIGSPEVWLKHSDHMPLVFTQ